MNAVALQILESDARLTNARHELRVIQAQKEARQHPPKWNIGDQTPIGKVMLHWLNDGCWEYRIGTLNKADNSDFTEAELAALIEHTLTIPPTPENALFSEIERELGPLCHRVAVERLERNWTTGGSRVVYDVRPMTQKQRDIPAWVEQMNATLRQLNQKADAQNVGSVSAA